MSFSCFFNISHIFEDETNFSIKKHYHEEMILGGFIWIQIFSQFLKICSNIT